MEHIRPCDESCDHGTEPHLVQGYFCHRCGGITNMVGTGHGEGLCERNRVLANWLVEKNQTGGPMRDLGPSPYVEPADPVTIGFRELVDESNAGHAKVQVFIGRSQGSRGNSGKLTIRQDEWKDLQARISRGGLDDYLEVLTPLDRSII